MSLSALCRGARGMPWRQFKRFMRMAIRFVEICIIIIIARIVVIVMYLFCSFVVMLQHVPSIDVAADDDMDLRHH